MAKYICIHGHFYQPPRENAWLEEVELQDSAYPYHDWNERVTAECYGPNATSRILDSEGKIVQITNNYARISFNIGPTLLAWMERRHPEIYHAILEADRRSQERYAGHGSAIAQVYNHMIMPLARPRDRRTQVHWGIRDFEKRFGRSPEGMWLPETAVDLDSLEALAERGIRFTLLAPHQIKRVQRMGKGKWREVREESVDTNLPYRCPLPSGRSINLFVYHGPISRDVAFQGVLHSGERFAERLLQAFHPREERPQLVHIATDGETYGHHHRFGDMALAYCLDRLEADGQARLTNYGEFLERHPPNHLAEIMENSSWSCSHGVWRWQDGCGCASGAHPGWTQAWRRPLRDAMDWLRDQSDSFYEQEASRLLKDPWAARDDYIEILLDRSQAQLDAFLHRQTHRALGQEEIIRTLKLLEMQRFTMLSYTSCGWFFDEVSGIETLQVLQYAARAMQLAEELGGPALESEYLGRMRQTPSNLYENAAQAYESFVRPTRVDLPRVGAHYAVSSLFEDYPDPAGIHCFTVRREPSDRKTSGRLTLATGRAHIRSEITLEEGRISFAVLHLGDHNINGGVSLLSSEEAFAAMQASVTEAFQRGDTPEVIRRIQQHFGTQTYSLWHLFRDEQRKILDRILQSTYEEITAAYRQIYENHSPLMHFLQGLHIPLPRPLLTAVDYLLNHQIQSLLNEEEPDPKQVSERLEEARRWSITLDRSGVGFAASHRIRALMQRLVEEPDWSPLIETIVALLDLLLTRPIDLDLWEAQNRYFSLGQQRLAVQRQHARQGEAEAVRWLEGFEKLGHLLGVRLR